MNDDLISRRKAIDATWEEPMYADPINVLTEVRDRIKALPSAQRTGRWIWSEEEWGYRCSACKVKFDYDKTYELFDHGFMLANYCPNCGAKMKGEEE